MPIRIGFLEPEEFIPAGLGALPAHGFLRRLTLRMRVLHGSAETRNPVAARLPGSGAHHALFICLSVGPIFRRGNRLGAHIPQSADAEAHAPADHRAITIMLQ